MKRLLTILFSLGFLLAFVPGTASAYSRSTSVEGTIYYNGKHVGRGIEVTVTCNGHTEETKTNRRGEYNVSFSRHLCKTNSTITVTATVDGLTGISTGTARRDSNMCNVNANRINVSVPELGVFTSIGAAATAGGAFLVIRRRQIGQNR